MQNVKFCVSCACWYVTLVCIQDRQYTYNITMARLRNHCCDGNTTMNSAFIVELHVAGRSIKTLSVAQRFMTN